MTLAAAVVFDWDDAMGTGDQAASIIACVATLISLRIAWTQWLRPERRSPLNDDHPTDNAIRVLATQVTMHWEDEAASRGLLFPEPLRIPWKCLDSPAATAPDLIFGRLPRVRRLRLRLTGDITTMVDIVRKLPARQLVITGPAASGKTSAAILLLLDLLLTRKPDEPVPVLFDTTEWDPASKSLDEWLTERLAVDYPEAFSAERQGMSAARRLIEQGLVMPIFDGINESNTADEEAESNQTDLFDALSSGRADRPFVLVTRTADYEKTVSHTGRTLARALVIQLTSVPFGEATAYLKAGQFADGAKWNTVVAHLRGQPGGISATILSSPLMIHLARLVHTVTKDSPDHLIHHANQEEMERALLSKYTDSIYPHEDGWTGGDGTKEYGRTEAHELLRRLTDVLEQDGTREFSPWTPAPHSNFSNLLRIWAVTAATILFLALGGSLPALTRYLGFLGPVLYVTWCFAMIAVGTFILAMRYPNTPAAPFQWHITRRDLLSGAAAGIWLTFFLVTLKLSSMMQRDGLDVDQVDAPELFSRYGPQIAPFALSYLALSAAIGALAHGRVTRTASYSSRYSPTEILRLDRRAAIAHIVSPALVTIAFGSAVQSPQLMPLIFSGAVLESIFRLSATPTPGVIWSRWQVRRILVTRRNKLPWGILQFADDAHRRGILEVGGTGYRFRHEKLRDHFSSLNDRNPAENS